MTASSFSYNAATNQAGALYSRATKGMAIKDCIFFRNTSPQGGAMAISSLTGASVAYGFQNWLLNCDFKENFATATDATTPIAAGALLIANSDTDLHACRFTANAVGTYAAHPGSGGAVLISSGAPQIFGSTFAANESASAGGAIRITGGTPHLVNCALIDNLAGTEGGGISIAEAIAPASPPATTILHATLAFNRAPQGSAIYHRSNTILYNSLSWFNENLSTALSSIEGTATLTAQGNNLSTALAGNVSIRPALAFDKVHLVGPLPPASPSILGSANYAYLYQAVELFPGNSSPSVYDYDYELRSMGTYPEAGCDEWQDSNADTLPDWFANYIAKYSTQDNLVAGANVSATTTLLQGVPLTLGQMYANGTDPLHLTTDMDGDGVPDSLDTNPFDPKVYPMAALTPLAATVSFSYLSGFPGVPAYDLQRLWNKRPWYSRILNWTYTRNPLTEVSYIDRLLEYPNDALHRNGYESKMLQYAFPLTLPKGASNPGNTLGAHMFDHSPNRQITFVSTIDGSTWLETEPGELVPIELGGSEWSRIWASRPYPLPVAQTLEIPVIWKKHVHRDGSDEITIEKAENVKLDIPAKATTSIRYYDAMPHLNEPGPWTDDVSYFTQPWPLGITEAGHQATPRISESHEVIPFGLTAYRRGTFNTPGELVPAGTGEFGYETVMMENADSESSDVSTMRDCDESSAMNLIGPYRQANDDDLVKIVLKWPSGVKPNGASLKLLHAGMKVDATQSSAVAAVTTFGESRINFYRDDGTRIYHPEHDLQILDLANAPADRYISKILTEGEVTLYIEGADRFGELPEAEMDRLGGAQLKWEFSNGSQTATAKLLVYRGGFLRFLQPAGAPGTVGTIEFRDGKGRVKHKWGGYGKEFKEDVTDLGSVLAAWTAKSGKLGRTDYRVPKGNGHAPPCWYSLKLRTDYNQPSQKDAPHGEGNSKTIQQGGYVRWMQDDNYDASNSYTQRYFYDASKLRDRTVGEPTPIRFKYQLETIKPANVSAVIAAQNRSEIQLHPDGECNGTAGCVGVQTYLDCQQVDDVLTNYHGLKIKVQSKSIQP